MIGEGGGQDGQRAPFDLEPFALDRFDSYSTEFTSDYIAESPNEIG